MIALRKLFQVFGRGSLSFLNPANRKILAYLRDLKREDGSHETVLCVANLSRFAQPVSLDLSAYEGMEPVEMLGYVPFPTITAAPYQLTVAPYSFLWLELQAATSDLRPLPEPQLVPVEVKDRSEAPTVDLVTAGWTGLLAANGLAQIEAALPAWLPRQRWFGAKSRRIQAVRVLHWGNVGNHVRNRTESARDHNLIPPAVFIVEVGYFEGEADIYQVPLAISIGSQADEVSASRSDSVLTTLASTSGIAILHDATYREDFRQFERKLIEDSGSLRLIQVLAAGPQQSPPLTVEESIVTKPYSGEPPAVQSGSGQPDAVVPPPPLPLHMQPGEATPISGESTPTNPTRDSSSVDTAHTPGAVLVARASSALRNLKLENELESRVGSAEQSNSSIIYGDKLILKLFRRLQADENPDVEIGRFLTEVAHFKRIPPFLGEISMTSNAGKRTTIAMLQGLVANDGDGWDWFLRQLHDFFEKIADRSDPPEEASIGFTDGGSDGKLGDFAGNTMAAAALLGQRTAELHLALSRSADQPAFAPEPTLPADLEADARQIEAQIRSSFEALKARFSTLEDGISDSAGLLLSRRAELIERSRLIARLPAAGKRIRIHGDYHLGQTLRVPGGEGDFVLLDFEGEPARPLWERRRKQSPLKDVAGMLRSFSYVGFSGLKQLTDSHPETAEKSAADRLKKWANAWQNRAVAEFLAAYWETIGANKDLLPPLEEAQKLLKGYVLEKALYELLYELNNRPGWLHIPIAGILSL